MTDRLTADQEKEFREHALTNGSPMSVVLAELDAVRKELAETQRVLAVEKHAVARLQHDYAERERIHNAEMNRMSEELAAAKTLAARPIAVCTEIREIVRMLRRQEARGHIDTPGGLEHMGDVWRLFRKWDDILLGKEKP